ncbi:hypothetical protein DFH06DRAFT_517215 [Mycena polygramma]|nr:hypothetical protein DFH06DRAFT_517215 [Mycena polygramma]
MNTQRRLQMVIAPDGGHTWHYPHALYTSTIDHNTISWIESKFRNPDGNSAPIFRSIALAVFHSIMVASAGDTIIVSNKPETAKVLGELVVKNSERKFWESMVQLRYHFPFPSYANKSYKWSWYDNTTTGIYHGIPGWTRFALHQNKGVWGALASIDTIGDDGDNVDDWSVLLSALENWTTAPADLREFCLQRCTQSTQIGFVNRISVGTHVNGRFKPLPGVDAADTVYLFLENLQLGADGAILPCRRYWSLDRKGVTPMADGLRTLYGLDQSEIWDIRLGVRFFNSEQFAALDELQTRFGVGVKRVSASSSVSWSNVRSPLKRSQSAMRLHTVDWRTEWMWEDHAREREKFNRQRMGWFRKRRPDLFSAASEFQEDSDENEAEVSAEEDPVNRIHRSKTRSVGGGLSLIFSHMEL